MCGIVGFTNFSERPLNEAEILKKMADRLTHRGPDTEGFWSDKYAALGHRRLVVVDPEGGKQPMIEKAGSEVYVMVYNGELYNTEDIRQELIKKGYSFYGWSDTEVLLKSYIEWGEECLQRFNGIFAFAIWNTEKQELFLARDRIGVKPLFYTQQGYTFLFASEMKAFFAYPGVEAKVDKEGLSEIFALGPARTPGCGVFSGFYELKPGWCMRVDKDGFRTKQYWALNSHSHDDSFDRTVESVRELVYDSIKRQLVSDVPLCTLLSGGLDSSVITAVAAEVYKEERNERINTFSIDYVDNDKYFRPSRFQPNSDSPWVKRVSEYLGTKHETCFADSPELVSALFPSVTARDLPGMTDVDSSLLLFSRWIKKRATVGISGECADEVFGGYPWFYKTDDTESITFPWSQRLNNRIGIYSEELLNLIKPNEYVSKRYFEAINEVPKFEGDGTENARKRELFYLNLTRWMPTLLDRKDRMSMASGVELRVPFCDHRLVEYVWNVPWEMKNYKGREKGLLRHAMHGLLPEDVLWRKKSPYPKTHNPSFIEGVRKLALLMLEDSSSPVLPFINKDEVRKLALTVNRDTDIPWFGQLMNAPQLLAYLLQVNFWFKEYEVTVF